MAQSDDRTTLIELVHRYFRHLDDLSMEAMRACFAPEFFAEHTLSGRVDGADAFIALVSHPHTNLEVTQHCCSNHEVTIDGDHAQCLCALFAQHVVLADGENVLMPGGGRYTHRFRRTPTGWLITSLQNQVTWMDPRLAAVFASRP